MRHIKTLFIISAIACFTAGLQSCVLESEDYGSINDTVFPSSEEDADMLVIGSAYEIFRLGQWAGFFALDTHTNVGDIVISKAAGYFPWNWGNYVEDMWPMQDPWNNYYKKLSLLEQTQEKIAGLPSTDDKVRARQIAEMKLAKGWLAFQLWTYYGNIPLVPLEALNDPTNEQDFPRSSDEEMEEYIVTNISEAIPDLELKYQYGDPDYGRFTQALGHTILLKFYMQKRYWDRAEKEARELMDPKYGFDLVPVYKDIFTLAGEGNIETIWSCVAERGICDGVGVFVANSLPFDYDCGVPAQQAWNGNALTWPFYNSFEQGDQRIDPDIVIANYTGKDGVAHSFEIDYVNGDQSKQLYWGPAAVKYEVDPNTTGYDSDIDWIVYRYADVLTLLAEAIVKQNGPTTEALELMNRVRTRAGLAPYQMGDVSTTEAFMEKLLDERAKELWWENDFRRLDLIRNDLWNTKMKEKCEWYNVVPYTGKEEYELFPIPTSAIISSHNAIEQNPGY